MLLNVLVETEGREHHYFRIPSGKLGASRTHTYEEEEEEETDEKEKLCRVSAMRR